MTARETADGGARAEEQGGAGQMVSLLYAGSREWFRSALQAVLRPEGFEVLWAHDAGETLDVVSAEVPDLVLVDEHVPGMSAAELCRALGTGPLPAHVPVVLYASDMSTESAQAGALEAGAWEVVREPIRAESLVASLRRLLRLGSLIDRAGEDRFLDPDTGLLTARGLMAVLPTLRALARRKGASLTCAVIGPTEPATSADSLAHQRELTARLCTTHIRQADLCGWLQEGEVAIVAFDASPQDALTMVRRLNDISQQLAEDAEAPGAGVSAGIAEVLKEEPAAAADREEPGPGEGADETSVSVSISLLATAREALEDARRGGGGIRIVDGDQDD